MQKAVLRSPSTTSTTSGKELLGLAVSGLVAPLWSLCSSALLCCTARPDRAQALAQKPAAMLGMVPARGRPGGGHRCDQLSQPARVLVIGLSRPSR